MLPRLRKVIALLERDEENLRMLGRMRAMRLGRLIDLQAPDYVIAVETLMVMEVVEALFKKHKYDPNSDDRVTPDVASVPAPRDSG